VTRLLIAAAVVGSLCVFGASPAAADPVNNPHTETFAVTCGGESFTVVAPGGSAGHVVGATTNLVLQGLSGVDPDFGPIDFVTKGLDRPGKLTSCSTTFTNSLGHSFPVTILVLVTGQGG
jgi:hypothetical protein